jgi:hypothetical protein
LSEVALCRIYGDDAKWCLEESEIKRCRFEHWAFSMKVEQRLWSRAGGWQPNFEASSLGKGAHLVLLFGDVDQVRESACFERVRASYPGAHVIGCTTAGQIHDARVTDQTVTLTAIGFEHTRVVPVRAQIENVADSFEAGKRLARALDPAGLRHVFVLSEGLKVNASELVLGIDSALAAHVTVSGGCAADGNRLETTHVWANGPPEEAAVVGLGFYGERLQVGVSAIGGWRPFGPDRVITRSTKNVLYEFDGRPALALYKHYLDKYAEGLPASGLMFPLELRGDEAGRHVLRALLSVNEEDQSITFAGNVPEGAQARFMFATIDDLIQGTHVAAKNSMQRLGAFSPQLSILISCNGRRYVLKQRTEEEVEAVKEALGAQAALTGFYSYGEIAPADSGGRSQLHNETMTITSFAES